MVTESVCNWFLNGLAWLIGLIPPLPDEAVQAVDGFGAKLETLVGTVSKLDPVLPFDYVGIAAGIVLVFAALALVIQGARIVLSFVTLGGGSV